MNKLINVKIDIRTNEQGEWGYHGAKSQGYEMNFDELIQFLGDNQRIGVHEWLVGDQYHPYADLDYKVENVTDDEFRQIEYDVLKAGWDAMEKLFPDGEVFLFCASSLKKRKISGHFIVSGIYYKSKAEIAHVFKQVDMDALHFDQAVYHKNRTMRMPLCSKPGDNRPLRFAELKKTGDWCRVEYPDEDAAADLSSGLITFIMEDDELMPPPAGFVEKPEHRDTQEVDQPILAPEFAMIEKCVNALKVERADMHVPRCQVIWALKTIGYNMKVDLKPLAHAFAKRSDDYAPKKVDDVWSKAKEKGGYGFPALYRWAKQDSPDLFRTLKDEKIAPSYYDEKNVLLEKDPSLLDVQRWMLGCLAYVQDSERWFVRFRDGWKPLPGRSAQPFPFATRSAASHIYVEGPKVQNKKGEWEAGKRIKMTFQDILIDLKDQPAFDQCRYRTEKFMPYFQDAPAGIFNTFKGWIHPFADQNIKDEEIATATAHLKDLCGGDEKVAEYVYSWLACLIQRPTSKLPLIVFYSAKQGVGKGILKEFLFDYVLGSEHAQSLTNMKHILGNFNAALANNLLTVMEEAKDDGKSISFADTLKDLIDGKRIALEKKGVDVDVKAECLSKFLLFTNHKFCVTLEASDRRHLLAACNNEHAGDLEYFDKLTRALLTKEMGSKFFNWLAQRDLSEFNPWKIPMTKYKEDVKLNSMPAPLEHIRQICQGDRNDRDITLGIVSADDLYEDFKVWCAEEGVQAKFVVRKKYYKEALANSLGLECKQYRRIADRVRGYDLKYDELDAAFQKYLKIDHSVFTPKAED